MRNFPNAINNIPHAEERPQGALACLVGILVMLQAYVFPGMIVGTATTMAGTTG
jgi:hypothetical protein